VDSTATLAAVLSGRLKGKVSTAEKKLRAKETMRKVNRIKSLRSYMPILKSEGKGTCEQGQTQAQTGCTPANGQAGGKRYTHSGEELESDEIITDQKEFISHAKDVLDDYGSDDEWNSSDVKEVSGSAHRLLDIAPTSYGADHDLRKKIDEFEKASQENVDEYERIDQKRISLQDNEPPNDIADDVWEEYQSREPQLEDFSNENYAGDEPEPDTDILKWVEYGGLPEKPSRDDYRDDDGTIDGEAYWEDLEEYNSVTPDQRERYHKYTKDYEEWENSDFEEYDEKAYDKAVAKWEKESDQLDKDVEKKYVDWEKEIESLEKDQDKITRDQNRSFRQFKRDFLSGLKPVKAPKQEKKAPRQDLPDVEKPTASTVKPVEKPTSKPVAPPKVETPTDDQGQSLAGQPCKPGQSAKRPGCIPKDRGGKMSQKRNLRNDVIGLAKKIKNNPDSVSDKDIAFVIENAGNLTKDQLNILLYAYGDKVNKATLKEIMSDRFINAILEATGGRGDFSTVDEGEQGQDGLGLEDAQPEDSDVQPEQPETEQPPDEQITPEETMKQIWDENYKLGNVPAVYNPDPETGKVSVEYGGKRFDFTPPIDDEKVEKLYQYIKSQRDRGLVEAFGQAYGGGIDNLRQLGNAMAGFAASAQAGKGHIANEIADSPHAQMAMEYAQSEEAQAAKQEQDRVREIDEEGERITDELAKMMREANLEEIGGDPRKAKQMKAAVDKAIKDAVPTINKLRAEREQLMIAKHRRVDAQRNEFVKNFGANNGFQIPATNQPNVPLGAMPYWEKSNEFINNMFPKEALANHKIPLTYVQDPSNTREQYTMGEGKSEMHGAFDNASGVGKIHVHEFAHSAERWTPNGAAACKRFLDYRRGDEPLSRIRDLTGEKGYDRSEMGFEDEFKRSHGKHGAYIGKDYSDRRGTIATEVISVGMEMMFDDPAAFAAQDPEYFAFVVGFIKGDFA